MLGDTLYLRHHNSCDLATIAFVSEYGGVRKGRVGFDSHRVHPFPAANAVGWRRSFDFAVVAFNGLHLRISPKGQTTHPLDFKSGRRSSIKAGAALNTTFTSVVATALSNRPRGGH